MEILTHIFKSLTDMISHSHWTVFALMILESTSLPSILPAEFVLITAGYFVAKGHLNWLLVVLASTVGSLIGSFINYYFALLVGRKLIYKYGKYIFLHVDKIKKLEIIFIKYSSILTFTGRLMPLVKHIISVPAGFCAMDKKKFTLFTSLGAGVLSSLMVTLGMFIGKSSKTFKQLEIYIYIGLFLFSLLIILVYLLYDKYLDKAVLSIKSKK